MPTTEAVLYVGPADEALDLADALATDQSDRPVVVTASTREAVAAMLDDDRLACLVCADPDATDWFGSSSQPAVPVIAYGVDLDGAATVTLDASADLDDLAARVRAALVGLPDDPGGGLTDVADDDRDGTELGRVSRGSDIYYAVDADWRVTEWDPRMEDRTGHASGAAVGELLWDLFPAARETNAAEKFAEVMDTREPAVFELYYEPGDYWVRVRGYPTDDGGVEFFTRDITEEKERERELAAVRERVENTLERIDDAFFAVDDEWHVTYFNAKAEQLLGRTADDVLGQSLWEEFPEAEDSRFAEEYIRAMETQEPVSFEAHYDPLETWFEVRVYPSEDGLSVYFRDVTVERELRDRLRALHETTGDLMFATTPAEVGQVAVEAASEILGLPMTNLWEYREPEDVIVSVAETDRAGEILGRRRFPAGATPGWEAFAAGEVRVFDDLSEHDRANPEMQARSAIVAPLEDFGFLATGSTEPYEFDDQDVELFRILATTVQAALYRAEREQELQRQNERLDEFVSVVSHDLRNPLQVAKTRLDVYQRTGESEHLDRVAASHDRMERLIDDLLALARQGEAVSDPEQVHLSPIVNEAWRSVDAPGATLESSFATTLVADPDRLQQLFENLFRNAVEHAGPDVTVTVDTTPDGFFVADDGPGIPPEDRERVFDHGFSSSDDGTGFGLSIVKRIVEAHDWTITVEESETGGARFTIGDIHSITATG